MPSTVSPDDPASWDRLDALIAVQFWRPAKFSLANEAINYRRFFAVSDLAAVRVEDPRSSRRRTR